MVSGISRGLESSSRVHCGSGMRHWMLRMLVRLKGPSMRTSDTSETSESAREGRALSQIPIAMPKNV